MSTLKATEIRFIISLSTAFVLCGYFAAPQNAFADDRHYESVIGTWRTDITIPGPQPQTIIRSHVTYIRDNTMISSSAEGGILHGAWKKVGANQFATKSVTVVGPPQFPPGTDLTVTGVTTIEKGGATGTSVLHFVWSIGGTTIYTLEGAGALTRITVDD